MRRSNIGGTWTRAAFVASALFAVALFASACKKDEKKSGTNTATAKNPCGAKANPCNPCGGKMKANPCNPCGGKMKANPCNPCGGAAKIDPATVTQPAGYKANTGGLDAKALLAKGEALFADKTLSSNKGTACATCHSTPALYKESFTKPYGHMVAMAKARSGMDKVTAAEMVQFCMAAPMKTSPLKWDSVELAALTAVVEKKQKEFAAMTPAQRKGGGGKMMANPCNPCGGKMMANPCNPCGGKMKNMKHMKNPCNPCGGKK